MTHTANNELTTGPGAPWQPGELVDVTIRGARVAATYLTSTVVTLEGNAVDGGPYDLEIPHRPDTTFARVAPAEWPPQPADVWSDRDRDAWMVCGDLNGRVEMRCSTSAGGWSDPTEVLASFGPMRLEYRPGWTPAVARPADEPVELDERAKRIAGLRALADFLEANPDLPEPYGFHGQLEAESDDQVRALAERFGLPVEDGDTQFRTQMTFAGGVRFSMLHFRSEPVADELVDERGDAEKTQQVEDDAAERRAVEAEQRAEDEGDDRCTAAQPGEFAPGNHKCELYGDHYPNDHLCLCGLKWPNLPPALDAVPSPRETAE